MTRDRSEVGQDCLSTLRQDAKLFGHRVVPHHVSKAIATASAFLDANWF